MPAPASIWCSAIAALRRAESSLMTLLRLASPKASLGLLLALFGLTTRIGPAAFGRAFRYEFEDVT